MSLITERVKQLLDPTYTLNCDVNPFISCGTVMSTWQASLLGFPNPLLGVAGFVAPIAVGVALLAGATFARWFWAAFLAGVSGALAFVLWLFDEAVFDIGVLCPWCMLVWAMVIPLFWVLLLWTIASGAVTANERVQRVGAALLPFVWVPIVATVVTIVVAIIVQFPQLLPLFFG